MPRGRNGASVSNVAGCAKLAALYAAACLSSSLLVQAGKEILDDHFAFDPRVCVMLGFALILALSSCAAISAWLRHDSPNEVRRLLKMAIRKLPGSAIPLHFATGTFVITLLVALLSHFGEHEHNATLQLGDAAIAFLTALAIAVLSALLSYLLLRALPEVVALVVALFFRARVGTVRVRFIEADGTARHLFQSWPPPLFNRPPPLYL